MEEAEIGRGDAFEIAHADADEFDLGNDEAVAGIVFTHESLEVREVGQVFDVRLAFAVRHSGIPDFVALDETNEAAAAVAGEGVGAVVGVGGEEVGAVGARVEGLHGDVAGVALAGFDCGVDFGRVVPGDDFLEGALVGGFESGGSDSWGGESGGFDGDVEEA